MKKFLTILLCTGVILITGCTSKDEEKVMNCSRSINQSSIKMDLNYKVSYKGDYVTKVNSKEEITADDASTLEAYKTQLESVTESFKDIEYYDHKVEIKDNVLTSTIDIDYTKIDTDALIEIDSSMSQLIKNGKVAVSDIEAVYNNLGITCKK